MSRTSTLARLVPWAGPTTKDGMSYRAVHRRDVASRPEPPAVRDLLRPTLDLLVRPGFALVVASMFLTGAVLQVSVTQVARDAALAERTAQAAALAAHVERTGRADDARLTGQATAFAAQRRTAAIDLARSAVQTAELLSASAAQVVDAATLSPLQDAVDDLSALVEQTPGTTEVVAQAVRSVAEIPDPVPEVAPPSPIDPGADAVELLAGPAAQVDPAVEAQLAAAVVRVQTAQTTIGELDLDESARVVTAAQQVLELSAQVQVAADAARAAAQAAAEQAAAAAAAQAAAEAAAADLARRVAATDAAPNGAIPVELLCAVEFDDDVLLRCDAAAALERLNAAYHDVSGRDLQVVSSYRDFDTQAVTRTLKGDLAAPPGASLHGRAVAVDISGTGSLGDFTAPLYLWLKQYAGEFGWHHPTYMEPDGVGPLEPWHWEFRTD